MPSNDETSESETQSENECETDTNSNSSTDDEVDDREIFPETQPLFKEKSKKRKKPQLEKQNAVKEKVKRKTAPSAIFEGWDTKSQVETKNIDFSQWQASHSNRETFFIGPDNYVYTNSSTMKKFVDMLKKIKLTKI